MNEEILIGIVPHGDTNVLNARLHMFGGDWVGANRNDVRDTTLCQRAGGLSRDETRGTSVRALSIGRRRSTDFPKKSRPSMMTLTFLNGMVKEWRRVVEIVVNPLAG